MVLAAHIIAENREPSTVRSRPPDCGTRVSRWRALRGPLHRARRLLTSHDLAISGFGCSVPQRWLCSAGAPGDQMFQMVVLAALIVTNAVLLFLLFRPVL